MKKNFIFGLFALVTMLFTASCTEEQLVPNSAGDTATVSFKVSTPVLSTRAVGDGTTASKLYVAVYENQNGTLAGPLDVSLIDDGETVAFNNDRVATVNLALAKNKEYSVIFWAETENNEKAMFDINWDERKLTLKQSLKANQEKYDAFWAQKTVNISENLSQDVKLTRPFSQLNIGTSDKDAAKDAGVVVNQTKVVVKDAYTAFDLQNGEASDARTVTYEMWAIAGIEREEFPADDQSYLSLNYLLMNTDKSTVDVAFSYKDKEDTAPYTLNFNSVPVQRNYRTNIYGTLLTNSANYTVEILPGFEGEYNEESVLVNNVEAFMEAFDAAVSGEGATEIVLGGDINLNDLLNNARYMTRATGDDDITLTIAAEKTLTIDLNGKKLSATSSQADKNYNMFDVRGTLTVKNGTMEYKHEGENMGWNASTNLFNVTAGGILNLNGVTAKNLGGSDMAFVAHLNNWGEVTLNVENSTLESTYVPVRVFNSGNDMNNVDIKNSTLKGGSYAFWVHNYTVEDFGSEAKVEAQKALLKLNIYNQGNTFSPDLNGIRYGFTNSVKADAYGITKVVSEDGTEVILGSMVENGLIRRGVAGTEENTTIKKVVVGEGVATLYDRTFRRFYALEEVVLPNTLTTIGAAGSGVFQSCTNLKSIVLPESVTVLGKGSFQECSSLESINIPDGVTRIESDALRATGLKSVEFHAGVTYFGAQAFRDCKQLTEVVIKAPEFTMEGNTFGIMAAPFTPMTIYVVNAEMKAYVESKLTDHAKTYITVVALTVPGTATDLSNALGNGERVVLNADLTFSASETTANSGYGATGVSVTKGAIFDGNGYTLRVNKAGGTWDCAINAKNGTIKNLTVAGAMRGIFMGGADGDVVIDNVIFKDVVYTFNSDAGNKEYGVYISNSTLNGWTSFSNAHKEVVFTDCTFGKGSGYAFCRPYNPCVFENCEFSTDMEFDATKTENIVFRNCTYGGLKITAENALSLTTGDKTFFYNGVGNVAFE